jgi:hypothetical protein
MMLNNDIYNLDNEFDYSTVKDIVLKALEKIVKQEAASKNSSNTINEVVSDFKHDNDPKPLNNLLAPHIISLLKLKIRNTTKYLNWRLLRLKRGNFTCQICHNSGDDDNDVAVLYQDPMKQNL